MPFLIQLREGGRSRVITKCTVRKWLTELVNSRNLRDTDGTPLHYTPNDLRISSSPPSSMPASRYISPQS
jgi:hypothetical protein